MSKIKVNEIVNRNGSSITIGDANTSTVAINSGTKLTGFSSTGIDDNATSTAITITSSQNVGIGTSSPARNLSIVDSSTPLLQLALSTDQAAGNGFELAYDGSAAYLAQRENLPMVFKTNDTEQMRIDSSGDLKFNSGYGSVATAYGCRAWVNFNGTGTVAIRDSGNISSITDNNTGNYTVNFATAMPDANYAFSIMSVVGTLNYIGNQWINSSADITSSSIKFTAGYRQSSAGAGATVDSPAVGVAIFR